MQAQGFIMDLLRPLFYAIDKIVYGLIEILYNLFAYTSNLTIFSNSDFAAFNKKVYLILGIVMLFKIAFSLIILFANPDDLMDSNKGITGIVKRIIFSLVLITLVPTIFNTAYRIQTIVIQDNVFGNFFLGNLAGDDDTKEQKEKVKKMQQNAGKMVSFSVLNAFYYPENIVINKYNSDGTVDLKDDIKWSSEAKRCIYNNGTSVCKTNEELMNYIRKETYSIDDYDAFIIKDFKNGDNRYYIMHYNWLISTIAGVVVAWIFFGFCFDTAIRAVKLSALQLIAPIPIFSYIDPKKGEGIYKKWYTTVISTYVGLFARLILIYFVIYICCLLEGGLQQFVIDNSGELAITNIGKSNSMIMMGFAKALIIIGLLMFAKDAPKLFSDMFGINMSSTFGMNLAKMGIVGTGLATGLGATKLFGEGYKSFKRKAQMGALESEASELRNKFNKEGSLSEEEHSRLDMIEKQYEKLQEKKSNYFRAAGSGLTTGLVSGFSGAKFNLNSFNSGMKKANDVQQQRERGVSFGQEIDEKVSRFFGTSNEYGDFGAWSAEIKELKNKEQRLAIQENRARERYSDAAFAQLDKLKGDYELDVKDQSLVHQMQVKEMIKMKKQKYQENIQEYEKQLNNAKASNDAAAIKKYQDQVDRYTILKDTIDNDFKDLIEKSDLVNELDKAHQKVIKEASQLEKKVNSLGGKK